MRHYKTCSTHLSYLNCRQSLWHAQEEVKQNGHKFGQQMRQCVCNGLFDVVEQQSALPNAGNDWREAVIHKYNVGSLFGHIATRECFIQFCTGFGSCPKNSTVFVAELRKVTCLQICKFYMNPNSIKTPAIPIAMPTLARLSAGASLTPSPVTDTTSPTKHIKAGSKYLRVLRRITHTFYTLITPNLICK